jgi:AraC-like DNA-binding protein
MDIISVVNFLLIAGVIQGFGFILITIFIKKKFQKAIIYLNFVVLFISLNNLQAWMIDNDFTSNHFFIQHLKLPWYLLIFPMFYAFTTHFLKIEDRVNDFIKLTLTIFSVELVVRLCLIYYVFYYVPNRDETLLATYNSIEEIGNAIYCLFIFLNATLLVFRGHKLISFILDYDDLNWLKWFFKFGGILMVLWVVAVVISNINGNVMAYYPLRLGDSILLYWIAYQGTYKYNVAQERIFLRKSIDEENVSIVSGSPKKLKKETDFFNSKHQKEFESITDLIISKKYYLDPLLSMETLTLELGMSKSHFSKLINSYSGNNFSDFINSLRVEQAKNFLSNNEFEAYTIVSIGLECGFNSKSTFYSAFRKFTSETPSSFRAQF